MVVTNNRVVLQVCYKTELAGTESVIRKIPQFVYKTNTVQPSEDTGLVL